MGRLAFICAANVCRSPMMHFTFHETLSQQSYPGRWVLSSRGTSVVDRNQICGLVEQSLRNRSGGGDFALKHHPQGLASEHLSNQDLVVVATVGERGKLARLNPNGRASVFTLREATLLGELPISPAELDRAVLLSTDSNCSPLAAYAQLLNSRRGLIHSRSARWTTRGWFTGLGADPMDIRDGHRDGTMRHSLTLLRVRSETAHFADQVMRFVAAIA